ncbi:Zinc finger protein 652 [Plecturocebus cupreus]
MSKPHLHETEEQSYFREARAESDVHAIKEDQVNSDDTEEQEEEKEVSYKRELSIVEVNLNNQTLNVSKGKKGTSSHEEEEREEEVTDNSSYYEENKEKKKEKIVEKVSIKQRRKRRAASVATAITSPTLRTTRGCKKSVEPPKHKKRATKEPEVPVQKAKCELVFNTRWCLEKHMNVTDRHMKICDKKFVLE